MHVEAETTVSRPRAEVFDYIARAERLPEYVTDFAWVRQESEGEPALGTRYSYKMQRGSAEGTFDWTEFEPGGRKVAAQCGVFRLDGDTLVIRVSRPGEDRPETATPEPGQPPGQLVLRRVR